MSALYPHLSWAQGYSSRREGIVPGTYVAGYHLVELMRRDLINRADGQHFLEEAGLTDFYWEVTWPEDFDTPDEYIVDRVGNVQGYAIFIHGWAGNHLIWEELPGRVTRANRQLVALTVDHNGFGGSPFEDKTPPLDHCNPPAAMRTIEQWINLIKLRRQPGSGQYRVINLIGHSMGGATLFYFNPMHWHYGEVTRCSLAPALLLEDDMRRVFYTTLGLGIGILQRIPILEVVERFIKPSVIQVLAAGASEYVKEVHSSQYEQTARGITGSTFMAMGRLDNHEIARDWDLTRVMLGHRDRLVGLTDMMDLLCSLEFPASNIRVVPGTHYMFSVGSESPSNAYQHAQNRDLVVHDILELHKKAAEMQRVGWRVG